MAAFFAWPVSIRTLKAIFDVVQFEKVVWRFFRAVAEAKAAIKRVSQVPPYVADEPANR
jgi:hypothetical protein